MLMVSANVPILAALMALMIKYVAPAVMVICDVHCV